MERTVSAVYLTDAIDLPLPIVVSPTRAVWECKTRNEALVATAKLLARGYVSSCHILQAGTYEVSATRKSAQS